MYVMKSYAQRSFENFYLPFSGKLDPDNQWIVLSQLVPWELVQRKYAETFDGYNGHVATDARIAFAALFIKEKKGTSDQGTVEEIQENPYLQFFLGYEEYTNKAPFDDSAMTGFRKRITPEFMAEINEAIVLRQIEREIELQKKLKENTPEPTGEQQEEPSEKGEEKANSNQGEMILDATCAPADITYPTDLKLLNTGREKTEAMIDSMHAPLRSKEKKPRTYRERARKDYLAVAKKRKAKANEKRRAIRKQLGYLDRNLKSIQTLEDKGFLPLLSKKQQEELKTIRTLYAQQEYMYKNKTHRVPDRIVSIHQPHIRPIVRGKAATPVEFGAKLSVSVVKGYVFVDRIDYNAYHEAKDLPEQAEAYFKRFGFYPEAIHCDRIYLTKENRTYCEKRGITLAGCGKEKQKDSMHESECRRVVVEGKFGQGKRRFGLARIMAKLSETGKTMISMSFLVINLERILDWIASWQFFCSLFHEIIKVHEAISARCGDIQPMRGESPKFDRSVELNRSLSYA